MDVKPDLETPVGPDDYERLDEMFATTRRDLPAGVRVDEHGLPVPAPEPADPDDGF